MQREALGFGLGDELRGGLLHQFAQREDGWARRHAAGVQAGDIQQSAQQAVGMVDGALDAFGEHDLAVRSVFECLLQGACE